MFFNLILFYGFCFILIFRGIFFSPLLHLFDLYFLAYFSDPFRPFMLECFYENLDRCSLFGWTGRNK
ncbi:hypothetical protein HMPREF1508_0706 [Shuttleworthella sp. MSX8B]|uniref:Uncharacterized protein n=1 Tax=Shuttleworthella satelles DSM 14600 TaxID=626523 RepID=C4GBC8_9FIRM|nr:hypothetical protein GCWU000342_01229 [Shuttleworthia satelles DSM 14600]EUB17469.1 hypothetical protein HMPREF1508_0706 [Shuttleworthia sp. MSX8B]